MKRLACIVCIVILASCKKGDSPTANTKLEMLASSKSKIWSGSSSNVKIAELNIDLDLYRVLPLCLTDDIMVIYNTKVVENKEGASTCDGSSTDVKNRSNWKFNADESSIIVENFSVVLSQTEKLTYTNQELKILELTPSTLKLEAKVKYREKDAVITSSFIEKK